MAELSQQGSAAERRPRPSGALLSALGLLLTVGSFVMWIRPPYGLDLKVYRAGAAKFLATPDQLYAPGLMATPDISLPFTYPPFAAFIMAPLAWMPFEVGHWIHLGLSLGLLWLVMRDFGPRVRRMLPEGMAWLTNPLLLTGLVSWTAPYRDSLGLGQVNILLFSVIYLASVRWGLGFLAGLATGLFGGIKLTPLALGLVPLGARAWRMIAGMAVGFLGSVALMGALYPALSREYWLEVLRDPSRIGDLGFFENISFEGLLARLGFDFKGLWFLVSIIVCALTLVALMGLRGRIDTVAQLGLGAAAMLFISPVSWAHHATWLPVIVYALVSVGRASGQFAKALTGLGAALLVLLGIGARGFAAVVGIDVDETGSLAWNVFVSLPALLLLAAAGLSFAAVLRMERSHGLFEFGSPLKRRVRR